MSTAPKMSEPSTREVVASNFSDALDRERWSERKAAAALGLTPAYINRRATGETEMSASDLELFAGFLKMREQDFFIRQTKDYGSHVSPVADIADYFRDRPITERDAIVTEIGAGA